MRNKRELNEFDRHQLRIAKDTLVGALVLGGPNKYEASEIIEKITGEQYCCKCGRKAGLLGLKRLCLACRYPDQESIVNQPLA